MIGSVAIAARQKTALAARVQREALAAGRLSPEFVRPELFRIWQPRRPPPPAAVPGGDLPELRSLLDRIRLVYADMIDDLTQAVDVAEARLREVRD